MGGSTLQRGARDPTPAGVTEASRGSSGATPPVGRAEEPTDPGRGRREFDSNVVKEFTYDAAGRTTAVETGSGTTSFAYDYEGRVTSITYPSTSSDSFGYNGLGARASTSGTNGSRTFLRNGLGVTSPVLEDGSADYTPGVSRRASSSTTFAHAGLKNTSTQSAENETVAASRVYDAFGNVVSSSGSWSGPFGYAGNFGYQEDASGLRLLGHRYYDSSTGRFLTRDPIGNGENWFRYTDGSPVSLADADGLDPRGGPPVGVPGDPSNQWQWLEQPGTGRGGKWIPVRPIPGQSQPSATWDPMEGHWDVHDGKGNTKRYLIDGKLVPAEYAHGNGAKNWRNSRFYKYGRKGLKYGGKVLKPLLVATLVLEGPEAAARDLFFADEVEAVGGAVTAGVEAWKEETQETAKDWYLAKGGLTRADLSWE